MLLIVLVVGALYAVYRMMLRFEADTRTQATVESTVGPVVLLGTGLLRSIGKRQGRACGPFPTVKLHYAPVLDDAVLRRYARVVTLAGGKAAAALPNASVPSHLALCYPQTLTVGVAASLVVSKGFPLSALGVLHTKQVMVQHAPLPANGRYTTVTSIAKSSVSDKGVEFVISVVLSDPTTKRVLWEGDTVCLSRNLSGAATGAKRDAASFETPVWDATSTHSVSGSTGLNYAAVSGDYNPHHLYWFTALPMGFSRPIAHGMWTLAAALSELAAHGVVDPNVFPQRVSFKKPLFMPGAVTFGYRKEKDASVAFGVYDKTGASPHIMATWSRQGTLL